MFLGGRLRPIPNGEASAFPHFWDPLPTPVRFDLERPNNNTGGGVTCFLGISHAPVPLPTPTGAGLQCPKNFLDPHSCRNGSTYSDEICCDNITHMRGSTLLIARRLAPAFTKKLFLGPPIDTRARYKKRQPNVAR